MKNFYNQVVKYTVSLKNLQSGTITAFDNSEFKVGDFVTNVQFVDECGNKMGKNGTIEKIQNIEFIG